MEFLLEIRAEEMPAAHVQEGLIRLKEGLTAELQANALVNEDGSWGTIHTYGTCRRLVAVGEVVAKQQDREELIFGPPRSAAFSPDGKPTGAAIGFARAQGIRVEDLQVITSPRGEYVGIKQVVSGKATPDILKSVLPSLIAKLSFPKMMRWGELNFRFSRPIKSILCLCDGLPLSFEVAGVKASAFTFGHPLFAPGKIKVDSFHQYKVDLRKHKVIIDREARKNRIQKLMQKKLDPLGAEWYPDEQLLEKLAMEVEYPYVFLGAFPETYLKLPLEVLSTAMKMGQNLFSVVKGRRQLPMFLGITDGCDDARSLVRKGNERVLRARLEDARFFWDLDLQLPLKERAAELDRVVFQEKLGSYADKTARLRQIVVYFADRLEARREKPWVAAAAELCKVDLLTEMVREFPSLQGKAGGLYARREGYPAGAWKAIYEHYQPVSLGDPIPTTLNGAILSICDKLDTVVGTLGLGVEVTGSKDPFGLRRNVQGVCMVILDAKLDFSFPRLLDRVIKLYGNVLDVSRPDLKAVCLEFFRGRLQYIFERMGFRYDLVNAALASGLQNIRHTFLRLKALDGFKDSPNFEAMILTAKRVNNILKGHPSHRVNAGLFQDKEERELYTMFEIIRDNIEPLIARGDFTKAQRIVFRIRSCVDDFFDHVMVMTDERQLRRNRLALLQSVSRLLSQIADYSQIVIQG
jgi:glycyl-tRNA synthetase beta chain